MRRSSNAGAQALASAPPARSRRDPLRRQLALAALVVQRRLELVEGDLAHHRVQHVLDLAGQHGLALAPGRSRASSSARKVSISPNTEAVSARVSGVSAHQLALRRRQHLVHAVAQLVRQRHHVARAGRGSSAAGRDARSAPSGARRRRAPCPAAAARRSRACRRTRRPTSASSGEKALIGRRAPASRASGQAIGAVVVVRQRRVAVPVVQLSQAEPLAPSARSSGATARIARLAPPTTSASTTSSSTWLARLREETGRAKLRQLSSISLSLASVLVTSAKSRLLSLEALAPDRSAAALRIAPSRSVQQVQRLGDGQLLAVDRRSAGPAMVSSNRRIQAARPATSLLVQQLLELVGELVRAEGAQVAQPGPIAPQRRMAQLRLRGRHRRAG